MILFQKCWNVHFVSINYWNQKCCLASTHAYQVTIGKIAEMGTGTGTSKKRAKESAARKLIPKI